MNSETVSRILLVEDDGSISQIIKIAMQTLRVPYQLDVAVSAEEAQSLWSKQPYDLVMSDYNLRGRNGLELISSLKAEGATAPMVLFTAYDTPQLRHSARQAGVAAFLAKPFFLDEFINLTRSMLPTQANEVGA